ncbi:LysR family transcriptional regulator [Exiguobacterium acetylicum]|uniref:LysR family transcriptional regulator n=1 Tax=Exiguobacterium TaxID=33986 RepID=UPI000448299A|nr:MULTISPECIES: LysR family transcriptional regulator [Exiguobacterium]EZP61654.1 LysR family transcriptional regulator [Exiguobacterium sp. RIT341]MDQ6466301.1 LysR family transcriptional regulator [Exiguobacterium acetylicum]
MDLRQYRYFCAVVEEQSVTRAAERLRMAQPALTQQIRRMEEELSVRLIERAGRGIRITPSGNRLYERAVSLLQFEQETRMELSDIEAGRTGILRIGVNTLSASRLVDWIEQMKRRHPGIILQVHQGESSALIERLKERSLDAALVRLPIDAQGVSIEWMEEEPFHQVWHPDHPTADLIIPSQEGLGVFQTLSQRLGVVSQETCSDVLTLIGLVRKGKAVTVLPESTLRELDTAGLHQTYLSGAASTTAFVWLTETGPTTLTKQFIEIMQETAK